VLSRSIVRFWLLGKGTFSERLKNHRIVVGSTPNSARWPGTTSPPARDNLLTAHIYINFAFYAKCSFGSPGQNDNLCWYTFFACAKRCSSILQQLRFNVVQLKFKQVSLFLVKKNAILQQTMRFQLLDLFRYVSRHFFKKGKALDVRKRHSCE